MISLRADIICFVKAACSDMIPLKISSSFSEETVSLCSLIIIDASLFQDSNSVFIEEAEARSNFSICIIPSGINYHILRYAERKFPYIISYPVKTDYFRDFCIRVMNRIYLEDGNCNSFIKQGDIIPESISGYFCGESGLIKKARKQILNAACSCDPVLLLGETGTGKTTAAKMIHILSERNAKEMISVSLSTVVESLAESTFFGHVKGSFTSADSEGKGYFEVADGSTLFLDEIGTASLSIQAMLLTVLETGNFKKVGMDEECHSDVRLIFATNADIPKMLREGSMRYDLYFRIYDNVINLPPLRKRKEDIRGLVLKYLEHESILISEDALERLENYNWPGNIRELHKCLRRALRNAENSVITADSIDFGAVSFLQ